MTTLKEKPVAIKTASYDLGKEPSEDANHKPDAIICDVDGTVALMHGNRSPFDWDKVGSDKPNQWVIDLVEAYIETYSAKLIFLSGRSAVCFAETEEWLNKHIHPDFLLYMRPQAQEFEKDAKIKHEIYTRLIKPVYDVQFVIDDRKQVVDMWRNVAGLKVAQVAEGKF
jgi:hypothetical protein